MKKKKDNNRHDQVFFLYLGIDSDDFPRASAPSDPLEQLHARTNLDGQQVRSPNPLAPAALLFFFCFVPCGNRSRVQANETSCWEKKQPEKRERERETIQNKPTETHWNPKEAARVFRLHRSSIEARRI